jgi:hypothetical protein
VVKEGMTTQKTATSTVKFASAMNVYRVEVRTNSKGYAYFIGYYKNKSEANMMAALKCAQADKNS